MTLALYVAFPSIATVLAMTGAIAVATFMALPSAASAMTVMAVSCATGVTFPGTVASCALAPAQMGALAYLIAQAVRHGSGMSARTSVLVGGAAVAVMAVAGLRMTHRKKIYASE